jgi:bifunctional non-homologous end joining protein LigD
MPLPRVQLIIPVSSKAPFDDPEWLFEFKYDGYRGLCYVEQGRSRFVSLNGNLLKRFDVLCNDASAELEVDDAILDGEVIAADETGRPHFYDLVRGTRRPSYVAFDLLGNGTDLRSLPLRERLRRLHGIVPKGSPLIMEALSIEGRGRVPFDLMREHDLEGILAKRLDEPYDPRTKWLKIPITRGRKGEANC